MQTKDITVLIVDDDQMIRRYLKGLLSELAITTIIEASSLAEARELLKSRIPHLVLLDILLPDGEGTSLISEITADQPKTVTVMISTEGTRDRVTDSSTSGARDFILKPFNATTVLKKLRHHIAGLQKQPQS